jgi:RNA polymerase sigma factor (TIGR02999 family)
MTPEELLPLVYDELRNLALAKLASENPGQTLDATALVHEAWLRIAQAPIHWNDRTHFFRTAATAMRRILVDRARAKMAAKRDVGMKVDLPDFVAPVPESHLIHLNEVLEQLAAIKPEHAKVVELRFFAGMTIEETAEVMGISVNQANRMWRYSKAWLKVKMDHSKS